MIITLVVDSYKDASNGITITTRRFAKILSEHGHEVYIMAGSVDDDEYIKGVELGISKIPVLYQVSRSQGFFFAKVNKEKIKEQVLKSDIVHFLVPFRVESYAKKLCDEYNIPSTAAFHLQPENITSTLRLNKLEFANNFLYSCFKKFYDKFNHVHCPSDMIANQLREHGYTSNLHVISNGVSPIFKKKEVERKAAWKDKFVILMIGRLSVEKRQDLIINAVLNSKYEKNIQIVLAGKGPEKARYEEMGLKLTNKIEFGFYSEEELVDIINQADLYVHSSDAEIEAISCIEAFSCGIVPIISDSKISATNQFALDELNLFNKGNFISLRDKIEYWYENPELKAKRSEEYIEYSKQFALENCVYKLEEVFKEAINEVKGTK